MMIIGCDLRTRYQQIAMVDTESGELVERRLEHESGEARGFYAGLKGTVRVGIEATGHTQWFEAMLSGLGQGPGCASSRGFRESLPCFAEAPSEAEGIAEGGPCRTADT
jgi:hypothetical protein